MANGLSGRETIELVRQVYNLLKLLTEQEALAGIILTDDTYIQVRREFADAAVPYRPAELDIDPAREHSFVVDGLLILRGTQLQ